MDVACKKLDIHPNKSIAIEGLPPILFTCQPDGCNEARAQVNDLTRCSILARPPDRLREG